MKALKFAIDPADDNKTYPLKASTVESSYSSENDYNYVMKQSRNVYTGFHTDYPFEGFKYYIHNPEDILTKETKFTISIIYKILQIRLLPSQKIIHDLVKSYSPSM
jgi:hypothetical protein